MKIKNYCLVAAVAAGLVATSASAVSNDQAGKVYLGVQSGMSFLNDNEFDVKGTDGKVVKRLNLHKGFAVGGDLGYHFTRNLRADVSFDYTRNKLTPVTPVKKSQGVSQSENLNQYDVLVNGYYDLPMGLFTPYVGAGLGYAHYADITHLILDLETVHTNAHTFKSQNGLGWQVSTGVKYQVMKNVDLGVGYRLLASHFSKQKNVDGSKSHTDFNNNILASLSYNFG